MGYYNTGEYYCKKCKHAHHLGSKIGKNHLKYANEEVKKKIFIERGMY